MQREAVDIFGGLHNLLDCVRVRARKLLWYILCGIHKKEW